jgi:hypothetical protein
MTRIEVKAERKGKDASQLRCVPCPRKQRPARGALDGRGEAGLQRRVLVLTGRLGTVHPPSVHPWRLGQGVRTPHAGRVRRRGFRSAAPRAAVRTPPVRAGARARGNLDRVRAGGAGGGLEPRRAGAAPGPNAPARAARLRPAQAVAPPPYGARLGDRAGRGGGRPARRRPRRRHLPHPERHPRCFWRQRRSRRASSAASAPSGV